VAAVSSCPFRKSAWSDFPIVICTETKLKGAFLVEPERREDERGFFARTWCQREFETWGLRTAWVQSSVSFNHIKGTLRGIHYQKAPYEEIKLVRCTMGAIFDVLVDLRPGSPTFHQWTAAELTAENRRIFYVPYGVAHGFQTLVDNTEVCYEISEFYHPEAASGVRWNDPALGIPWPLPAGPMSERDRSFPDRISTATIE
jgi:dTDP-4-dehydrorhamnose 3,5-epimerase